MKRIDAKGKVPCEEVGETAHALSRINRVDLVETDTIGQQHIKQRALRMMQKKYSNNELHDPPLNATAGASATAR